ncbi:hypothetical protein G6F54_013816 [Rhizopus delemar]|nr:hypothetical protein G6F54_013816 [Rhizopus delemar]
MFDDVPVHASGGCGRQDRVPVQHALADRGESALVFGVALGSIVLGVNREDMPAEPAQHRRRVQAGTRDPGQPAILFEIMDGRRQAEAESGPVKHRTGPQAGTRPHDELHILRVFVQVRPFVGAGKPCPDRRRRRRYLQFVARI